MDSFWAEVLQTLRGTVTPDKQEVEEKKRKEAEEQKAREDAELKQKTDAITAIDTRVRGILKAWPSTSFVDARKNRGKCIFFLITFMP
jgi:hypothetical protein